MVENKENVDVLRNASSPVTVDQKLRIKHPKNPQHPLHLLIEVSLPGFRSQGRFSYSSIAGKSLNHLPL
jgi:hypothetical protein